MAKWSNIYIELTGAQATFLNNRGIDMRVPVAGSSAGKNVVSVADAILDLRTVKNRPAIRDLIKGKSFKIVKILPGNF